MHRNSLASLDALPLNRRKRETLAALAALGGRATDRQLARQMGTEDCNRARPRVTELLKAGVLVELGDVLDGVSGKMVRMVMLAQVVAA